MSPLSGIEIKPHSQTRWSLLAVLIGLALVIAGALSFGNDVFRSKEYGFTDASKGGYAIVPASCPSSPHYAYECSPKCAPLYKCEGTEYHFVDTNCTDSLIRACAPQCGSTCSCPIGFIYQNNQCVFQQCPNGYSLQNNTCVLIACPTGFVLQNNQCVITTCPSGYALVNGQCIASNTCTPSSTCEGLNLVQQDAQCTTQRTYCAYGCANSQCLASVGPPDAVLTATPALVKKGETSVVTWTTQRTKLPCTVQGTNNDVWSGISGTQPTKPIQGETTYHLSCTGLDGSTLVRTAIVNIIPVYEEK